MSLESSEGDTPLTFDSPSLWTEPTTSAPEAAPASDPTVPDAAEASPPASATTSPPSPPGTGEQPRESTGSIPFDRHKTILETERKRSEDLEAKWKRVAWADQLVQRGATREAIEEALQVRGEISSNFPAFIERALAEAAGRPDLVQQVRSIAGRVLGTTAAAQAPTPEEAEPQPDFQDQNGTAFFSAPQLKKWQDWNARQTQAAIDRRIGPIEQERQQATEARANQEVFSQFYQGAAQTLESLKTQPHFAENFADIKAYIESQNYRPTLHEAYVHVLNTKVLPTLSQTVRAKYDAELRTQAQASSVNPKSGAASVPASPKSFFDLPQSAWK